MSYPSPQRVELDVNLKSPGMVVLADIDYPGWELTIDGVPAPIYPVNRAMRGAAVREGPHHLVYTYSPRSFRIGLVVSAVGLAAMSCSRSPATCVRSSGRSVSTDRRRDSSETDHE